MRPKIYICGPITSGELLTNVNNGTEAFVKLSKAGFSPLCPMWSIYCKEAKWLYSSANEVWCVGTVDGNPDIEYTTWIEMCLPWVVASDAVLRLPGESKGADAEVNCALDHSVPVFYSIDELVGYFKGGLLDRSS